MDLQPTSGLLEENQLVAELLLLLLLLLILLLLYHDCDKAVSSISHLAACLATGQGSPQMLSQSHRSPHTDYLRPALARMWRPQDVGTDTWG